MKLNLKMVFTLLAISGVSTNAHAAFLLDTGTPNNTGFPLTLDATDYAASEFHITGNHIIDSVSGYMAGGNMGDTFTVALYSDNNGHVGTQLQSKQATFLADGWNGVSALNWNANSGNFWVAFEVGPNDNSNLMLSLLLSSPSPAIATAFNDGSGYHNFSGFDYGVRVSSVEPVPLPAAAWLFISALGAFAGITKRRAKDSIKG